MHLNKDAEYCTVQLYRLYLCQFLHFEALEKFQNRQYHTIYRKLETTPNIEYRYIYKFNSTDKNMHS